MVSFGHIEKPMVFLCFRSKSLEKQWLYCFFVQKSLTNQWLYSREIKYLERTLKLGLLRVNSCKFRVLRVNSGSELAFSGLFWGKSISQA